MHVRRCLVVAMTGALVLGTGGVASSHAATAKSYRSCAALQKDYPHGVGRKGARDKTSGTPVTNFKRSNALYNANNGGPGERD